MVTMAVCRKPMPNCVPRVLRMVPMSREQNRPWAIAPRASMPYRRAEITMFLRLRKRFTVSMEAPVSFENMMWYTGVLTPVYHIIHALPVLVNGGMLIPPAKCPFPPAPPGPAHKRPRPGRRACAGGCPPSNWTGAGRRTESSGSGTGGPRSGWTAEAGR